jgi:hypothetical protein
MEVCLCGGGCDVLTGNRLIEQLLMPSCMLCFTVWFLSFKKERLVHKCEGSMFSCQ